MSTLKVDDIQSRQSTDDAISLASDSSVSLKHSASAKLTTTATGVSVTGSGYGPVPAAKARRGSIPLSKVRSGWNFGANCAA